MQLSELDIYFRSILRLEDLAKIDSSLNGLQVDRGQPEIRKVAFAVDACIAAFKLAADWGADLLCVHHGLFWGKELRLTGAHRERIKFLLDRDLALYAVHLPLDLHPEIGNNAGIARSLGLEDVRPFGSYRGFEIGYQGRLPQSLKLFEIAKKLFGPEPKLTGLLPFGKDLVSTVGIISGGGAREVDEAINKGLDLYITGESAHSIYHLCQEAGINVLFGGHYCTEVWGVRLLAEKTSKETGLETRFFDIPTGY